VQPYTHKIFILITLPLWSSKRRGLHLPLDCGSSPHAQYSEPITRHCRSTPWCRQLEPWGGLRFVLASSLVARVAGRFLLAREFRRGTIWARPNRHSCLMSRPSSTFPPTIPPPMTPLPPPLPAGSREFASSAAAAVATAPSSRMWPSIWAENWYNIALPLQHIQTNASNELVGCLSL
jgi:hypothetical protein